MERDSGVTDPAPDLVDADFNAHVARYSDIIVKYRNLNLEVGQRNDQLASKYDRLACFNQELGDDLARFDLEMGNLKHEIHAKTGKFKNLRKELDKLAKVVDKYRRILLEDREFHDSAQQVKRLEGKKRALLRKFRELQGEKIDIESHDVLKSRADLIEHVRCVDEANVEMIWLIELLRHLVDSNVPIQDRRDELKQKTVEKDRQLSKVNGEIAAVSKRIKDLEAALERRRQEKLSPRSETSELADDEMDAHSLSSSTPAKHGVGAHVIETPKGKNLRDEDKEEEVRKLRRCESDLTHSPERVGHKHFEHHGKRREREHSETEFDLEAKFKSETPRRSEHAKMKLRGFDSDKTHTPETHRRHGTRKSTELKKHDVMRRTRKLLDESDYQIDFADEHYSESKIRSQRIKKKPFGCEVDQINSPEREKRSRSCSRASARSGGESSERKKGSETDFLFEMDDVQHSESPRRADYGKKQMRSFESDQTLSPERKRRTRSCAKSPKSNAREHAHTERKKRVEEDFFFDVDDVQHSESPRRADYEEKKRRMFDSDQTNSPERKRRTRSCSKSPTSNDREHAHSERKKRVEEDFFFDMDDVQHSESPRRADHEEKKLRRFESDQTLSPERKRRTRS